MIVTTGINVKIRIDEACANDLVIVRCKNGYHMMVDSDYAFFTPEEMLLYVSAMMGLETAMLFIRRLEGLDD